MTMKSRGPTPITALLLVGVALCQGSPVSSHETRDRKISARKQRLAGRGLDTAFADVFTYSSTSSGKKAGGKKTPKGSKGSKSAAPSAAPSVSFQPSPSPSSQPSSTPTKSPAPSPAPSGQPSSPPTNSMAPSLAPSPSPSSAPSMAPSAGPTESPSSAPSMAPSVSLQPTMADFSTSWIDPIYSECIDPIPADSSPFVNQLIAYRYHLTVAEGAAPLPKIPVIEKSMHIPLSRRYLNDCSYNDGETFEVKAVHSAPPDALPTDILVPCNQAGDMDDCWIVDGAFSIDLFYMPSSRRLQETITDEDVAKSFYDTLSLLITKDNLIKDDIEVKKLEFQGFTNGGADLETFDGTQNNDKGTIAGINAEESSNDGKRKVVASSVAVVGAALVLLAVAFLAVRRRRRNIEKEIDEHMSLAEEEADETFDAQSYSTGIGARSLNASVMSERQDQSIYDKVYVLSDEEMYDNRLGDEGYEIGPEYPSALSEEQWQAPRFVSTGTTSLESSMRDLRPKKRAQGQRSYLAEDTVIL